MRNADASDIIVTACLLLMAVIGWIGYSGDLDQRLERRMEYDKGVWERARSVNKQLGCFRSGYLELYVVDDTLMTEKAEKKFRECL